MLEGTRENAVRHVVRFLQYGDGTGAWRKPLCDRAHLLLGTSLPYVSTLREIAPHDDLVVLVHDEHPMSLAPIIPRDHGLAPRVVLCMAKQLLAGLAALHALRVPHGDLRLRNVSLSAVPGPNAFTGYLWIMDTAIGGLPFWSGSRFASQGGASDYPPEWHGKPGEPSPRADLYALGVMLCEALLGTEAIARARKRAAKDSKVSLWSLLKPRLEWWRGGNLRRNWMRDLHARGAMTALIKMLLAEQHEQPADAAEALRQLQSREDKSRQGANRLRFGRRHCRRQRWLGSSVLATPL